MHSAYPHNALHTYQIVLLLASTVVWIFLSSFVLSPLVGKLTRFLPKVHPPHSSHDKGVDVGVVTENPTDKNISNKIKSQAVKPTRVNYICRALYFASKKDGSLLYWAATLLLFYTGTNLMIANFEGKIIDRVVKAELEGFSRVMKWYLFVMVARLIFSGLLKYLSR